MKELTIEEKAKAYDEALKEAVIAHKDEDRHLKATLERIFPELKESEAERIRKAIICGMNRLKRIKKETFAFIPIDDCITWLEKQGESDETKAKMFLMNKGYPIDANGTFPTYDEIYNIIRDGIEKQGEQKYADKVKPEFREGDWIVQENIGTYKVIEVCEAWYEVIDVEDNHYSITFDKEYMCHFWTIQDAKPGDVLASKDELSILIFRNLDTSTIFSSYYNIQRKGELGWSNECFIPATKEQRDLLFRKMKEAGYEWDAEKKELIQTRNINNE